MVRPGIRAYKLLFAVALTLFVMAAWLSAVNVVESYRAGRASNRLLGQIVEEMPHEPQAGEPMLGPEEAAMPTLAVDGADYLGILSIPPLDLELPVALELSDELLHLSPCAYAGSYLSDDLIICGEGYESHFGRLRTLGISDELKLTTVDGSSIEYIVSNVEVDRLEEIDAIMDDWDLALFTYNIDGTCLVVRCVRSTRG